MKHHINVSHIAKENEIKIYVWFIIKVCVRACVCVLHAHTHTHAF